MLNYLFAGIVLGLIGGSVLSYVYSSSVLAEYKKAASEAGVLFQEIEGKVRAVKKLF